MKRFLLAHAKTDDTDRIELLTRIAREAIEAVSHGEPFEIVTGRDQFEKRFKACGSWDAWAAEVGAGVEFATRQPLFHAFLVPATRVGAGTARIVEHALRARKPIFVFRGDGNVARVTAVRCVARGDWATGWVLTIGQFTTRGRETSP